MSKKKAAAADAAEVEAAVEAVEDEFADASAFELDRGAAVDDPPAFEEDPGPPPDDPVIFGGTSASGGSVELTILPPGVAPESVELATAEPEFVPAEFEIVDHLAPVRAEAEVLYETYHKALQGLPYPPFHGASAAQQVAWLATAERSLAPKEA